MGEVAKVNMNKISRRLFEMVDYITQRCLWVNKKLSRKTLSCECTRVRRLR